MTTDFTFDKGDEKELAAAAMSRDGVVLNCWQHPSITDITKHLSPNACSRASRSTERSDCWAE